MYFKPNADITHIILCFRRNVVTKTITTINCLVQYNKITITFFVATPAEDEQAHSLEEPKKQYKKIY
jgi:hypothetical protein